MRLLPPSGFALYAPTNEAILLTGTLLQLGDSAIQLSAGDVSEVDSVETGVCRVSVYRDEFPVDWASFVAAPVRHVIQQVSELTICRNSSCPGDCRKFHPAVEEKVEQVVMDVWSRQFQQLEGGRDQPSMAAVFHALLRVPGSALTVLQRTMHKGVYFEPRSPDGGSPRAGYAVVWLPGSDAAAALHAFRTCSYSQAIARLGRKFGIRVKEAEEQLAFEHLRPAQEFVKVKAHWRYKLHPLPHGSQRHTVLQLLRRWQWSAKPLQPIKGDR